MGSYFKMIAFTFAFFLFVCSHIGAAPVIHGSKQMNVGENQTLKVLGGEGPYTWRLIGGGGDLSATRGDRVIYTAPSDNPHCLNNPIIHVFDREGEGAIFQIAVNALHSSVAAFRTSEGKGACKFFNNQPYCFFPQTHHACDGSVINSSHNRLPHQECGDKCTQTWLRYVCEPDDSCSLRRPPMEDLRNENMKATGCCPWELLEMTRKTNDVGNVSAAIPLGEGSSVHFGTGNLFYVRKAGGIALRYNSLDNSDSPLGKNWTLDYGQKLTFFRDSQAKDPQIIILKKDDGNVFYYRPSNDIYYPEPVTKDASQIVKNGDKGYTLTTKDGLSLHFDVRGRLTTIRDRNNRVTSMTYIDSKLAGITDFNNRTTTFTYTAERITGITDNMNRTTTLAYTNGRLAAITDPTNHTWRYDYDDSGKMIRRISPLGKAVAYTYDARGRLMSATDDSGKTMVLTYVQPNVTRYTGNGQTSVYTYSPGFAVKTGFTDSRGYTTRYYHDDNGHLSRVSGYNGRTMTYACDDHGNLLQETDSLHKTRVYTYNNMNKVTTITDPRGNTTRYEYDPRGNLTAVTDPSHSMTRYLHDHRGNVLAMVSPFRKVTSFGYDSHNNLITITDPAGDLITMTYDGAGNLLTLTDPSNHTTNFRYDASNRLVGATDHRRHERPISELAQSNVSQKLALVDSHIRKLPAMENAAGFLSLAASSSSHSRTEARASAGEEVNVVYDAAGNIMRKTFPSGGAITYTYDGYGNRLTQTAPDNRTTHYTYDLNGRLVGKTDPDGRAAEFQYDDNGNMTYAGNPDMNYTFTYDEMDRLINIVDANNRAISYTYDAGGRRAAMTNPSRQVLTWRYNDKGLIRSAGDISFAYDTSLRHTKITRPNGTATFYTYDEDDRLTSIRTTRKNAILERISYSYNADGNRISLSSPSPANTFSHNEQEQLTEVVTVGRGKERKITFTYDLMGRRKERTVIKDELGKECIKGLSCPVTAYTYDDNNRLIKVKTAWNDKAREVVYSYDPLGRRISKSLIRDDLRTGHKTSLPLTRLYVYDQDRIIQEYDGAGNLIRTYAHDTSTEAPLFYLTPAGNAFFYLTDDDGSVTAITNSKGVISQRYAYNAFGEMSSPPPNFGDVTYAYKGREYDAETGLYFYRGKYYDPQIGRFITPHSLDDGDIRELLPPNLPKPFP